MQERHTNPPWKKSAPNHRATVHARPQGPLPRASLKSTSRSRGIEEEAFTWNAAKLDCPHGSLAHRWITFPARSICR